jgi:hypothetical protein
MVVPALVKDDLVRCRSLLPARYCQDGSEVAEI